MSLEIRREVDAAGTPHVEILAVHGGTLYRREMLRHGDQTWPLYIAEGMSAEAVRHQLTIVVVTAKA